MKFLRQFLFLSLLFITMNMIILQASVEPVVEGKMSYEAFKRSLFASDDEYEQSDMISLDSPSAHAYYAQVADACSIFSFKDVDNKPLCAIESETENVRNLWNNYAHLTPAEFVFEFRSVLLRDNKVLTSADENQVVIRKIKSGIFSDERLVGDRIIAHANLNTTELELVKSFKEMGLKEIKVYLEMIEKSAFSADCLNACKQIYALKERIDIMNSFAAYTEIEMADLGNELDLESQQDLINNIQYVVELKKITALIAYSKEQVGKKWFIEDFIASRQAVSKLVESHDKKSDE